MEKDTETLHGGLLMNKEAGMTSFDVLRYLKKGLPRNTKLGHSGTLDPFATGVLIILLGHATRLQDELHLLPKTYRATLTLGANTTTDDITGEVLTPKRQTSPNPSFVRRGIRRVLLSFRRRGGGEVRREQILIALNQIKSQTSQIPPDYAAIKIQGQKMYDLARAGKTIEKKPRPITIHNIILENYTYPTLEITVTCSTGTYIRSIARDIGDMLGTGAYCSALERTTIGPFSIENSYLLKDLPKDLFSAIIPLEQLASHIQSLEFPDDSVAKLKNGREVECEENVPTNTPIALLDEDKKLFGIGIRETGSNHIKSKKIFL